MRTQTRLFHLRRHGRLGPRRRSAVPRPRGVLAMPWTHSLSTCRDRLAYRTLCFLDRFRRKTPKRLATTRCATFPKPNSIENNYLYLTQIGPLRKWASFGCPDNCGKIVRLRLASSESPHWKVTIDWLGRATVTPSIRQLTTCSCHFWVRHGCIQWCGDTPQIRRTATTAGGNPSPPSQDLSL